VACLVVTGLAVYAAEAAGPFAAVRTVFELHSAAVSSARKIVWDYSVRFVRRVGC
jgi:hypothetical protein